MKKNDITLEDLSAMMAKGFGDIAEKFELVDEKFEVMNNRFDVVDKKFEKIDKRFDEADKKFEGVSNRLDGHNKRFDVADKKFEKIMIKLLDHDDQLQDLRENMFTKQDARQLFDILDKHTSILMRLDQERIFTNVAIKRLEEGLKSRQLEINMIKKHLKLV